MQDFNNCFDFSRTDLVLRLRSLADDLEVIGDATVVPLPTVRLDRWALAKRAVPCLIGTPTGHPRIDDGRPCFSSELYYLDPQAGLARTFSRWYRLGKPVDLAHFDKRDGGWS
ncbi:DUF6634 family protein [Ensifer sp. ENS10]|uniref:DUF6634 family protein n=1 Tax=Ensifer sp. ENS10 TaxID=2769286 RepID=UPI00281117BD|nr:DUF6634 family protein [Ensifer sp. ENS10]